MDIHINPFEDISEVDLKETTKESPLKEFKLPKGNVSRRRRSFIKLR